MLKRLLFLSVVFILIIFLSLSFAKGNQKTNAAKLEKISEAKYIYTEGFVRHHLKVYYPKDGKAEVIDTLRWISTGEHGYVNPNPGVGDYLYSGDTVFCDFKLIPDPARLLKVRGLFEPGGQAHLFIWEGANGGDSWAFGNILNDTTWDVTGDPTLVNFNEIDLSNWMLELPFSSDPNPVNRPYFQVGYVCSGTATEGGGRPSIRMDFNDVMLYVEGTRENRHSWFTWNGEGYYSLYYPSASPITWAQWELEAVVNYYNGTTPFINSLSQLNDTWKTSTFKTIEANLVDVDGTITESYLFYQKNNEDPDSVSYSSVTDDMYYFDIPGSYTAGDSISYWIQVTDNDGKSSIGASKHFKVLAPANPTAPILVVFDGLSGDAVDLSVFWQPLLDAVIVDSLGLQYEGWNVQEHRGIDNSITDYQTFEHALVVGFSVASVPAEDYANSVWKNFVDAGKNILIASCDYLYQNNVPENFTPVAGDFAYDILGIGEAVSDPNNGADPPLSTGDQYIVGVQGDPISDMWSALPITFNFDALLSGQNWNDYASADPGNPNAATIFTGVVSGEGNGVRNIRANNGVSVYLPFNLSAMADTTEVGDPYILPDAYQMLYNILHYFQTAVGIADNNLTKALTYELKANYPNPFNPSTNIEYSLKNTSEVSLVIYNLLGEKVRTLVNETQAANRYRITWDGTNDIGLKVASGIYIYKLTAGNFTDSQKMVLMK